jgi:hypothetical protein
MRKAEGRDTVCTALSDLSVFVLQRIVEGVIAKNL